MTEEIVARLALGAVRGSLVDGAVTFRGVPYARSPGGSRRFEPALPLEPWDGVRDATTTGARCPQGVGSIFHTDVGPYFAGGRVEALQVEEERDDEDCLNVAVVTPSVDPTGRRPVIVYLHGGGFMIGSGVMVTAAQRFVLEHDMVLVGVNHRLGVFGFASSAQPNLGLLDVIAALRWVHENIAAFGGDPSCVTILGDSGGGSKVAALLSMPDARGLFHRAALQSAPEHPLRTPAEAHVDERELVRVLGLSTASELISVAPADLFAAGLELPPTAFTPVADGRVVATDAFSAAAAHVMPEVPVLVGHDLDELTLFVPGGRLDPARVDTVVSYLADPTALRLEYGIAPGPIDPAVVLRAASDAAFAPATARFAAARQAAGGAAFSYLFTAVPPLSEQALGAFHTSELPLALRLVQHPECESVSRTVSAAWAAFARTGDPSTPSRPWTAGKRMILGGPPASTHTPFWNSRPPRLQSDLLDLIN